MKIISVLIIFLGGVFFFRYDMNQSKFESSQLDSSSSRDIKDSKIKIETDKINMRLEEQKKYREENLEQIEAGSSKYWDRMIKISQGRKNEIRFYGKVIDQHDNPVNNATVQFIAASGFLVEGDGVQFTKTDSRGVFEVKNYSGTGLGIESIKKNGYRIDTGDSSSGGQHYENYRRFSDSKLWSDYNKVENAAVFRAWRLEGGYPNTSHLDSGGYLEIGKTYSYDITSNQKKAIKKEGSHNLDFQVTFQRSDTDWSITLVVPEGGVIEQPSSLNLFEAPENGDYQSIYEISGSEENRDIPHKHFYIFSRGYYGKMELHLNAYRATKASLDYEIVINQDKGRNLVRADVR